MSEVTTQELNPGFERLPDNSPLQINYQLQIVRKSQEEGEKDLVSLANECSTEGAWFFVPAVDDWYSVATGHEEILEGEAAFMQVETSVEDFRFVGKKLFNYHTHTKDFRTFQENTTEKIIAVSILELGDFSSLVKPLSTIVACAYQCLPSLADLKYDSNQSNNLSKFGCEFKGKIASPFGIITVNQNEKETLFDDLEEKLISHSDLLLMMFNEGVLTSEKEGCTTKRLILNLPNLFQQLNKYLGGKIELGYNSPEGLKGNIIFEVEQK